MVIAVVALIGIGPERLPRVARTMGHLFGRLQRYVNDVKADINREMELEELRKFKTTFEDAARGFETSVNTTVSSVQGEVAKTEGELSALAQGAAPAADSAPEHDPASGSAANSAHASQGETATAPKDPAAAAPEKTTA